MLKIKIIKEVYSDKQRKFFCASDDPELNSMCDDPMKEEHLEEVSGVSSVSGAPALGGGAWKTEEDEVEKFNKNEKEVSKLKGKPLEEMYSTLALSPGGKQLPHVDEFSGYQERSNHQGLQNVPKRKLKIKFRTKSIKTG